MPDDRPNWTWKMIGAAILVGVIGGVLMSLLGRALGLSHALLGGVTGAAVAVIISRMHHRRTP